LQHKIGYIRDDNAVGEYARGRMSQISSKTESTSDTFYLPHNGIIIKIVKKLECGPMPNVMAALPNIGGALCSTPESLADVHY